MIDLEGGATHRIGEPEAPDVRVGPVIEGDRQPGRRIADIADRRAGADLTGKPHPVAGVGVGLAGTRDGRARQAAGLMVGEGAGALRETQGGSRRGSRRLSAAHNGEPETQTEPPRRAASKGRVTAIETASSLWLGTPQRSLLGARWSWPDHRGTGVSPFHRSDLQSVRGSIRAVRDSPRRARPNVLMGPVWNESSRGCAPHLPEGNLARKRVAARLSGGQRCPGPGQHAPSRRSPAGVR